MKLAVFFMNKRIITHEVERSKRLNSYLQGLKGLYEEDLEKMIYFCYEEFNATYDQVAKALGKTPQAVHKQYPKKGKKA